MTSTTEFFWRGTAARISFVEDRVFVVIDGVQHTLPNPRHRKTGRRRYRLCVTHFERLVKTTLTEIEKWKADREAKELAAEKDHAYA